MNIIFSNIRVSLPAMSPSTFSMMRQIFRAGWPRSNRSARNGAESVPGPGRSARSFGVSSESVMLVAVLAAGLFLRAWWIGHTWMWVDEAESCINALTILEHGYPADRYLGLPIFENTLVTPWPESEEYEFRDSSYSSRGMAVYHGWLPLYAISGTMALLGIAPDQVGDRMSMKHTPDRMWWRNIAPRLPAALFGLLFMVTIYLAGREMGGRTVGWTALTFAAFARSSINIGTQARYYSATLLLSAACGLVIWRIMRDGKWRQFILLGVLLAMMFHTHMLSCAVLAGVFCLVLPSMRRDPRLAFKALTTGAILATASVPWLLLTGFLGHSDQLPRGWTLLRLPGDLQLLVASHLIPLASLTAGGLVLLTTIVLRERLPERLVRPFSGRGRAYAFLMAWAAFILPCFVFLVPAASFFGGRLFLMLAVPCTLLLALVLTGSCEAVAPRFSVLLAPLAAVGLMAAGKQFPPRYSTSFRAEGPLMAQVDHLRSLSLEGGTRLYSTPNDHLILTYFTGLPVQSIAPVRKSFLDAYPGPIVILDLQVAFGRSYPWQGVRELAREAGSKLSEERAKGLARELSLYLVRSEVASRVAELDPPLASLPAYLEPALRELESSRLEDRRTFARTVGRPQNPAIFRDFVVRKPEDWWPIFFYRFVDPESRMGERINYADRIREARAVVLPEAGCVVFHAPARRATTRPGAKRGGTAGVGMPATVAAEANLRLPRVGPSESAGVDGRRCDEATGTSERAPCNPR